MYNIRSYLLPILPMIRSSASYCNLVHNTLTCVRGRVHSFPRNTEVWAELWNCPPRPNDYRARALFTPKSVLHTTRVPNQLAYWVSDGYPGTQWTPGYFRVKPG